MVEIVLMSTAGLTPMHPCVMSDTVLELMGRKEKDKKENPELV